MRVRKDQDNLRNFEKIKLNTLSRLVIKRKKDFEIKLDNYVKILKEKFETAREEIRVEATVDKETIRV